MPGVLLDAHVLLWLVKGDALTDNAITAIADAQDRLLDMALTDYRYFKFRPVNKFLVESLVNPSWYFSDPARLNDPFDCNANLRAAFSRAAQSASGRRKQFLESALSHSNLLDNFGSALAQLGVCAFSLGCKETLMWSHYADELQHARPLPSRVRKKRPANPYLGLAISHERRPAAAAQAWGALSGLRPC